MDDTGVHSNDIHWSASQTLGDARLVEAYRASTTRLLAHRTQAIGEVPGFERLRDRAREVKRETIEHLDYYLAQFADNVARHGGQVHWASTAEEVCNIVMNIARRAGVREVVKAKSMLGEEVELNQALEGAGIRPVESDLGEFIIQLAGDRPAHIVAPAIHKTREDVSELFVAHLRAERTVVPEELTAIARRALREWLRCGYPPDLATVDRVLSVALGSTRAADIGSGRRVRRSRGRLCLDPALEPEPGQPLGPQDSDVLSCGPGVPD